MKKIIKLIIGAIVLFVIIGIFCGSSAPDQSTPEKAAEAYFTAIEDIDVDAMIALTNDSGEEINDRRKNGIRDALIRQKTAIFLSGKTIGEIVKECDLPDGRAQVAIAVTDADGSVGFEHMTFKKVGEKWYAAD